MYTTEENCQIVIALLRAHGIRRIIASPGSTNVAFVGSVQNDPFFEVYSAVDERHAAYLAVGMAAESGEPVVLSCTGATASRNYIPALTEAYYRKLPILAVTSSRVFSLCGQLTDQFMDRTQIQRDIAKVSVWCPIVTADHIRKYCARVVNEAILALTRNGGGPAHINLETQYPRDFTVRSLPAVQKIERIAYDAEQWPTIEADTKVVIYIGAHRRFSPKGTAALERFVKTHQAVVLVSPVSAYCGVGCISGQLLGMQGVRNNPKYSALKPDLIINIGEISADYGKGMIAEAAPTWRVSEDGEIRDLFGRLEYVFEMREETFFNHYAGETEVNNTYLASWQAADAQMRNLWPVLPFSNNRIAQELCTRLPKGCSLHAGILSSVRSIGYLEPLAGREVFSNVGGFGIDGNTSTLVGASLVNPEKLFVGMVGDLSFFYDMNALGNRHIGRNLRLLVVNNGCGCEFSLYNIPASQFGPHTNDFIGAGGHFGAQSQALLKHYAEDLGFKYLSATTTAEFLTQLDEFLDEAADRPIIMECFVNPEDEKTAWKKMTNLEPYQAPESMRSFIGRHLPKEVKETLKKVIK